MENKTLEAAKEFSNAALFGNDRFILFAFLAGAAYASQNLKALHDIAKAAKAIQEKLNG